MKGQGSVVKGDSLYLLFFEHPDEVFPGEIFTRFNNEQT
jgi:hypothetical protein